MRVAQTTITSILALGLLVGSAVGVAAQNEAADPMAPNWFDWETLGDGPPEFSEDPATGLPSVTVEVEATDSRASGTLTAIEDFRHDEGDERYRVGGTSMRLANDGGAWVGTSRFINGATAAPNGDDVAGGFTELNGEGDYEGLTLFLITVFSPLVELPEEGSTPKIGFIVPTAIVAPYPEPPAE